MKYFAWSFYCICMVLATIFAASVPMMWPAFVMCGVLALLAAEIIFLLKTKEKKIKPADPGNYMQIFKSIMLETVILDQRKMFIDAEELKHRIEKLQIDIEEFVSYRDKMQIEFGMKRFGEIYSSFSLGELYINRAWSAIVDSNIEEAYTSVSNARKTFTVIGC